MTIIIDTKQSKQKSQKPPKSKSKQKLTDTSSALKKKSTKADFQQKFKSEMCKNWENGFCEFADQCAFAHGDNELREKTLVKNYKTKKCKQFHELGFCIYGTRCQFIHRDLEADTRGNETDTADSSPVGSRAGSRKNSEDVPTETPIKRRLPIFIDLEKRAY